MNARERKRIAVTKENVYFTLDLITSYPKTPLL